MGIDDGWDVAYLAMAKANLSTEERREIKAEMPKWKPDGRAGRQRRCEVWTAEPSQVPERKRRL